MKEKIALIRKRMLTAQSRQKSYADKCRRELKFAVGDLVYLKVSPMQAQSKVCWTVQSVEASELLSI